jgi:hypothetical protein
MRMPRPRMCTLVLASYLAACGSEQSSAAETYVARDSANVQIVESRAPLWSQGVRVDTAPVLRIGREEEGPYQFASIPHGLILDGGRFAIVEGRSREIRLFDSTGSHLATSGRSGSGPGEFQHIAGLFRYRGDSLAAYDQRLRRTTIIPSGPGVPRTVLVEPSGNLLAFGTDQSGHVFLSNPGSGYRPDLTPGLQWDTTDVVVMAPDGTSRIAARQPSRQQFVEPDGNTRPIAPQHGSIQATSTDGFYWATSDRYEIRQYSVEGVLQRILRRPLEPRSVESSMFDSYVEANLEVVRRFEGESSVPRYRRTYEAMIRGDQIPLFQTAFADADRRLWVAESIWPDLQQPPRRWSVFAPDGFLLGELDVPDGLRVLDSRGDRILAVWHDEFDVPHVQLNRLVR